MIVGLALIAALPLSPVTPAHAATRPASEVTDIVTFGDAESETAHAFASDGSEVVDGARGQAARVAVPLEPATRRLGDLSTTLAVDPAEQNHVTLKLWGDDASALKTHLLVNGERLSYTNAGDHEAINVGTQGGLPGRFFFATALLPLSVTQGHEQVRLTVRTENPSATGLATSASRGYYQLFTHTTAAVHPDAADTDGTDVGGSVRAGLSTEEQDALIASYRTAQLTRFGTLSAKVDAAPTAALNISKYANELRYYAEALTAEWSPADTPEARRAALERIFQTIDVHTLRYYNDVISLGSGGHQSDWGGYYSELGEALYVVENVIADGEVLGADAFAAFLAEPFETGSVDGANSIAGVDWAGGELSRFEAWERVLKATFDFARSRQSYISNQVHYTYEGAWKAHEGLRVIGSGFYEGKDRSHEIIREIWGMSPYLGEEVLVGPDGGELDVYHSLFNHDGNAEYTEDYLNVVMRGLAQSKLDDEHDVVRRRPYGDHYFSTTGEHALLRENRYVGSYGETANWLPTYFFRTWGHAGDEQLNAELLKRTLQSLHSRAQTRYQGVDADGNRVMYMEQVVDERNTAYPGKVAYSTESARNAALLYAALEEHMAQNAELYPDAEWSTYWEYAREAVGFAQQQLIDNRYFEFFSSTLGNINNDHRLPETWEYITGGRADHDRFDGLAAGAVFPHTDLDLYTDEELDRLGVARDSLDDATAWVDIDNLFVSVRHDDTTIFGSLAMRNYGYTANGRLHVRRDGFEHNAQIRTSGLFDSQQVTIRQDGLNNPIIFDATADGPEPGLVWAGEIVPITYQPGVGTIDRDNFVADTPYSAYPDVITAAYDDYFIAINTTRGEYGNERAHSVPVGAGIADGSYLDLVSGKQLKVKRGMLSVTPETAVVLVAEGSDAPTGAPDRVDAVVATPGATEVGLSWRRASGAESFTVSRSGAGGAFHVVAEGVTTSEYVDDTVRPDTRYRYAVTAVNAAGTSAASSSVDVRTGKASVAGWQASGIGSADASSTSVDVDTVVIANAAGAGFGGDDDFNIYDRWHEDSVVQVSQLATGDVSVSAELTGHAGEFAGITIRDGLDPVARYVALGAGEDGELELRVRALDSRVNITGLAGRTGVRGEVVSPRVMPMAGLLAADFPFLRLDRDADRQQVVASVSADGVGWQRVAQVSFAAITAVHAGVVASDDATYRGLAVAPLDPAAVRLSVATDRQDVELRWNKPKQTAAFTVYRTFDVSLADTDPVDGDGWEPIADGIFDTGLSETLIGVDAAYRVVAHDAAGDLAGMSEPVTIGGFPLETLIADARAFDTSGYTEASVARFHRQIDKIDVAAGQDGADPNALGLLVLAAYDILNPVYTDGFEASDPQVWTPGGSAPAGYSRTFETDASTAHSGERSMLFTSSDTTGSASYNLWYASATATEPRISVKPGTTYIVSFWYQLKDYAPGTTVGAYLFLRQFSGGTGIGVEQRNWLPAGDTPDGEWAYFERTFEASDPSATSIGAQIGFRGSSGSFRVDDLRVEPVEPEFESIEALIAEARAFDLTEYTTSSAALFTAEIDAVEEESLALDADEGALATRLLAAYALLVGPYRQGFEATDPVVWQLRQTTATPPTYSGMIEEDADAAYSGSRSLVFRNSGEVLDAGHNIWMESSKSSDWIPAAASTTYAVSFRYQLTDYSYRADVGAYAFLRSYNGTQGLEPEQRNWLRVPSTAPGEWAIFEGSYTTSAQQMDRIRVDLGFRGSTGSFRVDDLVIIPVE
ncbi:hypothetical protein [Agromyces bauzanensis]